MENIKSKDLGIFASFSSYRGYIDQSTVSKAKEATYKARTEWQTL